MNKDKNIKMFDDKGNHTLPYFKQEVKRMFGKVDRYLKSKNKKYNKPRDRVPFRLKMRDFVFKERGFGGDILFWYIVNSIFNRPFNEVHTIIVNKLVYAIHIIYGYASYGTLPVSIIQNKRYDGLLAKDRGHITTMLKIFLNKAFSSKIWNSVLKELYKEDRLTEDELKTLSSRISKITKNGKSLEEVIPADIFDDFMEQPLMIEVAVESLQNHLVEIKKINNVQNKWTDHQITLLDVQNKIQFTDSIDDNRLDEIYSLITSKATDNVKELFRGNKTLLSSTKRWAKSRVNFEEESLYLWLTVMILRKSELEERRRYHMFNGSKSHLKKAYQKIVLMSDDDIQKEINFLLSVSKAETLLENFLTKVNTEIKEQREAKEDIRLTNIEDLRATEKIGAGLSTALCVREIMEELNLRIDNDGDVQEITDEVYRAKMERLDDATLFEKLRVANGTLAWRAELFYIPIRNQIIQDRQNQDSESVIKRNHWTLFSEQTKTSLLPVFEIFGRKKNNVFQSVTIDKVNRTGFDLGHKITNLMSLDNTFLSEPLDNKLNGANNIDDMVEYADKYESDLEDWVKSNGGRNSLSNKDYDCYRNTLTYIDYMRGI